MEEEEEGRRGLLGRNAEGVEGGHGMIGGREGPMGDEDTIWCIGVENVSDICKPSRMRLDLLQVTPHPRLDV